MRKEQFLGENVLTVVSIFLSHYVLIPSKPPSSFPSTFIYDLAGRLENTVCGDSKHFFSYKTTHVSSQKYSQYKELQASLLPGFLIPIQFMVEAMSHKWNRICTKQQSL